MAEREHFTNGRVFAFGTGFGLVGLAFSAQMSSWNHWITIGMGYGSGLVLMLAGTVLLTKSYYSRESHKVAANMPELGKLDPASDPSSNVLTPLQFDIFSFTKRVKAVLRAFIDQYGPEPTMPQSPPSDSLAPALSEWYQWQIKLGTKYQQELHSDAVALYQRLVLAGVANHHLASLVDVTRSPKNFMELAKMLNHEAVLLDEEAT